MIINALESYKNTFIGLFCIIFDEYFRYFDGENTTK